MLLAFPFKLHRFLLLRLLLLFVAISEKVNRSPVYSLTKAGRDVPVGLLLSKTEQIQLIIKQGLLPSRTGWTQQLAANKQRNGNVQASVGARQTDTPTRVRQSLAERFNSGNLPLSVKTGAHCDLIMTEFLLYRRWSSLNERWAQLEFYYYFFSFFSVLKTWSKINSHDTCKTWVPSSVLWYLVVFF